MKTITPKPLVLSLLLACSLMAAKPVGDPVAVKLKSQSTSVQIAGSSSLHDWTEKSDKGTAEAIFTFTGDKISGVSALTFTVPAKSLKSEHTMMDNNTYKALNADKNPNITYVATSANVTSVDANTYNIKSVGKLTIAGTTNETEVVATAKVNSDKSITITGSKKFKMSEYGVKPPTAMFGTIKTGDPLTISYDVKFVK
ncbi:MAG TPA: YceI family protein [Segetibacter sp.]|nr:YceI family protein [Segetibacter sp.]